MMKLLILAVLCLACYAQAYYLPHAVNWGPYPSRHTRSADDEGLERGGRLLGLLGGGHNGLGLLGGHEHGGHGLGHGLFGGHGHGHGLFGGHGLGHAIFGRHGHGGHNQGHGFGGHGHGGNGFGNGFGHGLF